MKTSCKLNKRGHRHKDEPYVQWMFHFKGRDSIDATCITEEEMEWAKRKYSIYYKYFAKKGLDLYQSRPNHDMWTIVKMFKLHFPEELI